MLLLLMVAAVGAPVRPDEPTEKLLVALDDAKATITDLGVADNMWDDRWWYAFTLTDDVAFYVDTLVVATKKSQKLDETSEEYLQHANFLELYGSGDYVDDNDFGK